MMNLTRIYLITLILFSIINSTAYAVDTYMSPELYRAYGKQQIKTKDSEGKTVIIDPAWKNYRDRNEHLSEKIVIIYDKRAPHGYYGARYVLYTPIGKYVGHHKIMQPSLNGYGYEPIWEYYNDENTPCFRTVEEAKHYYYPQWY